MDLAKDPISGLWYRPHTWDLDSIRRAPEIARAIEPGDVVLDLGAHIGGTTWAAVEHGAAYVDAVEPHPQGFELLRRNLTGIRARCTRPLELEAYDYAIGPGPSRIEVILHENARSTIGHTTMVKPWTAKAKAITVERVPLRHMMDQFSYTTVLCDIEGAEYTLPWKEELPASVRVLLIEFHYRFMPEWHAKALELERVFTQEMGFVGSDPVPPLGMAHNSAHVFRRIV